MPILPLECCVYPEDLLGNFHEPWAGGPARWWVLHTRPKAEKSLARRLLRRRVSFFLPQYERTWRSRGRILQSYLPLFPSYLFLYGDGGARIIALETQLVARSLTVDNQWQLHEDLARVYYLVTSGLPLTPEDRLIPGARVEITSGPLSGLIGKYVRKGKRLRVCVEVEFLRRGVSVEMESWMIRPVAR